MATLVPQDLAFADSAPITFEHSHVVAATPGEIWAVLCDHERWPEWFPSIKSVTATSEPPSGVGSTRIVALNALIKVDERFIAWDEPTVWAFTGTSGPGIWRSLVERVTMEPVGDATRVTYRMAIEPKGGCKPLVSLMGGGVRKALSQALANLDGETAKRRKAPTA